MHYQMVISAERGERWGPWKRPTGSSESGRTSPGAGRLGTESPSAKAGPRVPQTEPEEKAETTAEWCGRWEDTTHSDVPPGGTAEGEKEPHEYSQDRPTARTLAK